MTEEIDDPGWDDIIDDAIDRALSSLETSFPAIVTAYDHDKGKAQIRPVIRDCDVDPDTAERTYELGDPIDNVPYAPTASRKYGITFPLERGDLVWCNAGQRSLDEFLNTGNSDNTPQHPRKHHRTDAVITAIIHPFSNALPSDAIAAGKTVVFGPEVLLGDATATLNVALDKIVNDMLGAIDLALGGWVVVPADGGAALKAAYLAALAALVPPIVTGAVPSVSATKVKAT
jgi:hypothetical protein